MRLIDADALKIQFANECLHNCYYCKLFKWDKERACHICGLIDNAPTVELDESIIQKVLNKRCMTVVANEYLIALHGKRPQGEWIPVSERLPERNKEVIVTDIETEDTYCSWYHGNGYWECDNGVLKNRIIAWQPLPEPYKKGGAE